MDITFNDVSIICAFIGMIIGFYFGYKGFEDMGDGVAMSIVGFFTGGLIPYIVVVFNM